MLFDPFRVLNSQRSAYLLSKQTFAVMINPMIAMIIANTHFSADVSGDARGLASLRA